MFKPLIPLAALLFTASLVHANCADYGVAGITCSGPDGYGVTQSNYSGGSSIVTDNRGNSASINRYEGGAVSITAPSSALPERSSRSINIGSRVNPYQDPFAR